jgi:hypothetical protein
MPVVQHRVDQTDAGTSRESPPRRYLSSPTTVTRRRVAIRGHLSLNTTRLYTTPTEQDLAAAVERLAE